MKIKYEWEVEDIEVGMRVSPADRNDKILIVGWANWLCNRNRYVLIDPQDGMVYAKPSNMKSIAAFLTEYNYRPRPELRNASIS
jgi:hypothetical protein